MAGDTPGEGWPIRVSRTIAGPTARARPWPSGPGAWPPRGPPCAAGGPARRAAPHRRSPPRRLGPRGVAHRQRGRADLRARRTSRAPPRSCAARRDPAAGAHRPPGPARRRGRRPSCGSAAGRSPPGERALRRHGRLVPDARKRRGLAAATHRRAGPRRGDPRRGPARRTAALRHPRAAPQRVAARRAFVAVHVVSAVIGPDAAVRLVDVVPALHRGLPAAVGRARRPRAGPGRRPGRDRPAAARIGQRAFRAVHWAAYAAWPLALLHAAGMGSDVATPWMRGVAGASASWWSPRPSPGASAPTSRGATPPPPARADLNPRRKGARWPPSRRTPAPAPRAVGPSRLLGHATPPRSRCAMTPRGGSGSSTRSSAAACAAAAEPAFRPRASCATWPAGGAARRGCQRHRGRAPQPQGRGVADACAGAGDRRRPRRCRRGGRRPRDHRGLARRRRGRARRSRGPSRTATADRWTCRWPPRPPLRRRSGDRPRALARRGARPGRPPCRRGPRCAASAGARRWSRTSRRWPTSPSIARHGSEWFRRVGTVPSPGRSSSSVAGAVARPGMREIALGTRMGALIEPGRAAPPAGGRAAGGRLPRLLDRRPRPVVDPGQHRGPATRRGDARNGRGRRASRGRLRAAGDRARVPLPGARERRAVRSLRPRPPRAGGRRRGPRRREGGGGRPGARWPALPHPRSRGAAPARTPTGPRAWPAPRCGPSRTRWTCTCAAGAPAATGRRCCPSPHPRTNGDDRVRPPASRSHRLRRSRQLPGAPAGDDPGRTAGATRSSIAARCRPPAARGRAGGGPVPAPRAPAGAGRRAQLTAPDSRATRSRRASARPPW